MKVYKEEWKDGKLVVGEQTEAPGVVIPTAVKQLLLVNGISGNEAPRPKLFNRADAVATYDLPVR